MSMLSMTEAPAACLSLFPMPGFGAASGGPSRAASLRFADCELHVEKRELVVAGAVQRVQPRVFDLLLYLVERRDRVVTRDELLRHVWRNEHVSDSVIGRCIMKARRVIGDIDPQAPFIRTLPRAGYRFVRDVICSRPAPLPVPDEHPAWARVLTVAALPFHNGTGRDELVWVEFGLAALLNMQLEAQRGLAVTPLVEVLTELRGSGTASTRAVERMHAGGVRVVIAVQVHACEDGFELRYRLHGEAVAADAGQLRGSDPTQLTIALGRKLARELASRAPVHMAAGIPEDSFTSEAFFRARRAAREQRYQMAQDYLQVCIASEPHAPAMEVELEHVESLAATEHPDTPSRAQCLLARAAESADVATQARVLRSLAAYYRTLGNDALARMLIQQALALLEPHGEASLKAAVWLERCELAIADREFGLARELCSRVLAAAPACADPDRLVAQGLRQEGVIEHLRGRPERALEALRRSQQLSRTPHLHHADLARTLHRIAIVHRDAGRLREARAAIDEAVHCARLAGTPVRQALTLAFQLTLHSHAGHHAAAQAAQRALESPSLQQSRAGQFLSQLTGAWLCWREGRIGEALQRMEPVRRLAGQAREFWLGFAIAMHAGMAIAGAHHALARELIAEIEGHRDFYEGTCQEGLGAFLKGALAHAEGDRSRAWHRLREAIAVSPAGLVRASACLAAAWLACEDRALDEVQGWLDQAGAWTAEHPSGITTLARYRFERGDWAAAAAQQARYVEGWPGDEVSPYQRQLLRSYREAARTGTAVAIPRMPQLPTLRF